jgi:hypothetical protein
MHRHATCLHIIVLHCNDSMWCAVHLRSVAAICVLKRLEVCIQQGLQRRGSALPSFSTDVPVAPPPLASASSDMGVFAPQATINGHHRMPSAEDLDSLAPRSARCALPCCLWPHL